ncbi:HRDC domain-containing protein [Ornithobacterium rhinotracheale]
MKLKDLVKLLVGKNTVITKSYSLETEDFFGIGKDYSESFWRSIGRQSIVNDFVEKEVESYGILKLNQKAFDFIAKPHKFEIAEDHDYEALMSQQNDEPVASGGALDETLLKYLQEQRKKSSKKHGIPPFAIFQDASLEDMASQYPTTMEELTNIFGVGEGKAKKFGKPFIELIERYVEDNDIEKPNDIVIKQIANKSTNKVYIIQSTDRKMNLEDIAKAKGMSMEELLSEMESIVYQGTKININYYIEEVIDEDLQEEIMDFLMEDAETDSLAELLEEFGDDLDEEELRLMRIKFISEVAN